MLLTVTGTVNDEWKINKRKKLAPFPVMFFVVRTGRHIECQRAQFLFHDFEISVKWNGTEVTRL